LDANAFIRELHHTVLHFLFSVSMLPIDGINRETSISMILHSKNSGARYDSLPPGLHPRGLNLEQAAAFATRKRTRSVCKFKQCDVTRAVKAVSKAGVAVAQIEIAPDGRIIILTNTAATVKSDDLDRELADFEARK
jgi:hypothetical protein